MLENILNIWKPLLPPIVPKAHFGNAMSYRLPLPSQSSLHYALVNRGLVTRVEVGGLMKQKNALTVSTVSRFLKLNFLEWTHNCNFSIMETLAPNSTRVTKLIKYSRRYNEKITLTDT